MERKRRKILILKRRYDIPVSCGVLSTVEACRPGINSSKDVGSSSEVGSGKNYIVISVYIFTLFYLCVHNI